MSNLSATFERIIAGSETSSVKFEAAICAIIDKLMETDRLSSDVKRGIIENCKDYIDQAQKSLEPSLSQFEES